MSQEKVERYKKEKANRKKEIRKQRLMDVVRKVILTIAAIALIGWLGYSTYTANQEREAVSVDYDAVDTYSENVAAE